MEEEINKNILWVLKIIKKELILTPKGENVKINILDAYDNRDEEGPFYKDIWKIIRKIEESGAFKIVARYNTDSYDPYYEANPEWENSKVFLLAVCQSKFEKIYTKYKDSLEQPPNDNKKKKTQQELKESLFFLKIFYLKIIEILDVFASGPIVFYDNNLNDQYIRIISLIEIYMDKPSCKTIKAEKPDLFESLMGNIEEIDMDWEFLSKRVYNFLGKLEKLYIMSGSPKFIIPKELNQFFKIVDKSLIAYKTKRDVEWKQASKQIEEQVKTMRQSIEKYHLEEKANVTPKIDTKEPTWAEISKASVKSTSETIKMNFEKEMERKRFKSQRILNSKEERKIHTLNTIIERIEPYGPNQKTVIIDYHYFNYEDRMDDSRLLEKFLDTAKNRDCFKDFTKTNYSGGVMFSFIEINLDRVKEYRDELLRQQNKTATTKIEIVSIPTLHLDDNKKTNKFPHKLPAGTKWKDFIIQFNDDYNINVQVKGINANISYKDMRMVGKDKNQPSEAWVFLRVLAKNNGELTITDPEAKDSYRKQKQLLSENLNNYFRIDYDPFYPYFSSAEKHGNSYKTKITMISQDSSKRPSIIVQSKDKINKKYDLNEDINEFYTEQTPIVVEDEYPNDI